MYLMIKDYSGWKGVEVKRKVEEPSTQYWKGELGCKATGASSSANGRRVAKETVRKFGKVDSARSFSD